jgi:hypothetical protein
MKIEYCEILETNWGWGKGPAQTLVGTITLKDGKLSSKAEKGHDVEMENIMLQSEGEDPAEWFNNLPRHFDGAALRVRLLKKGDRPWKRGGQADVLAGLH